MCEKSSIIVKEITKQRFDAFAAYTRRPETMMISREMAWFEVENIVLGVVLLDYSDGDYTGIILGRDEVGRFRYIDHIGDDSEGLSDFVGTIEEATTRIKAKMEKIAASGQTEFPQGGDKKRRLDPLKPVVKIGKQNKNFRSLIELGGYSPALEIMKEMLNFYEDPDGNFIEQFQSTGFDARLWELYLFGVFTEMGFLIDRSHNAPDFACDHFGDKTYVEAVILGQSQWADAPIPENTEQVLELQKGYISHRFASSLTSKLEKRYWELEHVVGHPLILAIADFSAPGSMTWTHTALPMFLYGYEYTWQKNKEGKLEITPVKIEKHFYNGREIPSAFFEWEDVENISAVLFSNSGTISKFNRIGKIAGFGDPNVRMIRFGQRVNHDENAEKPHDFSLEVHDPEYREDWAESVSIFHNPNAKYPINPKHFPGATHHFLDEKGFTETFSTEFHQFWSITNVWVENAGD